MRSSGYLFLIICAICAGVILYAMGLLEQLKLARLRISKLESDLKILKVELNHAQIAKKILKKSTALLMILTVSCTNGGNIVMNSSCTLFSKIYLSRADSLETKWQVLAHNLTYDEVCQHDDRN